MIVIEKHNGINVLRDDLLPGGTKSILMKKLIKGFDEYVYASPVYGGFQIALAEYCKKIGKKATIFCAKRKIKHENTIRCIDLGANVIEIPYGYLSVVEKRARDYCEKTGANKLTFGAATEKNRNKLSKRVKKVIKKLGKEPDEIWCVIGSGTLVESILKGTKTAKVYGVQVGAEYNGEHDRLTVMKHHLTFDKKTKHLAPFKSTANYDLKGFEYCEKYKKNKDVLFWNVL